MGMRGIWVFIPEGKSSSGLGGEAFNLILGIVVIALIVGFMAGFIRPTYEYRLMMRKQIKLFFLNIKNGCLVMKLMASTHTLSVMPQNMEYPYPKKIDLKHVLKAQ